MSGMDMDSAASQLTDLGLQVSPEFDPSEVVAMGKVISQTPPAVSQVRKGDVVTLTVSSGPSDMQMPDVYDMSLDEAKAAIEQMGLKLENVSYEEVADVEGRACDWLNPRMPKAL